MAGILYGIGIGPGDPKLMTFEAAMRIRQSENLAIPGENPLDSLAFEIVAKFDQMMDLNMAGKTVMGIPMPMTKDQKELEKSHDEGAELIINKLEQGEDVAYLTIGDPTIYSTYMYVHEKVKRMGYEAKIISGVPSFCAAAAKAGIDIGSKDEQIHIIPASYDITDALKLAGTKIFMKAGSGYRELRKKLDSADQGKIQVVMVENCGMDDEHIYYGAQNLPEQAGYFTIIFVKDRR